VGVAHSYIGNVHPVLVLQGVCAAGVREPVRTQQQDQHCGEAATAAVMAPAAAVETAATQQPPGAAADSHTDSSVRTAAAAVAPAQAGEVLPASTTACNPAAAAAAECVDVCGVRDRVRGPSARLAAPGSSNSDRSNNSSSKVEPSHKRSSAVLRQLMQKASLRGPSKASSSSRRQGHCRSSSARSSASFRSTSAPIELLLGRGIRSGGGSSSSSSGGVDPSSTRRCVSCLPSLLIEPVSCSAEGPAAAAAKLEGSSQSNDSRSPLLSQCADGSRSLIGSSSRSSSEKLLGHRSHSALPQLPMYLISSSSCYQCCSSSTSCQCSAAETATGPVVCEGTDSCSTATAAAASAADEGLRAAGVSSNNNSSRNGGSSSSVGYTGSSWAGRYRSKSALPYRLASSSGSIGSSTFVPYAATQRYASTGACSSVAYPPAAIARGAQHTGYSASNDGVMSGDVNSCSNSRSSSSTSSAHVREPKRPLLPLLGLQLQVPEQQHLLLPPDAAVTDQPSPLLLDYLQQQRQEVLQEQQYDLLQADSAAAAAAAAAGEKPKQPHSVLSSSTWALLAEQLPSLLLAAVGSKVDPQLLFNTLSAMQAAEDRWGDPAIATIAAKEAAAKACAAEGIEQGEILYVHNSVHK